jgi:predicted lipid-binding transport protein (Tim44 family)
LSDSLIGDLALTTSENGTIRLTKVQGTDVKINSKNGEVNISSLYGGNTLVNTQRGNVVIGDAHGKILFSSCETFSRRARIRQPDWLATNTDNITTQSHLCFCLFARQYSKVHC